MSLKILISLFLPLLSVWSQAAAPADSFDVQIKYGFRRYLSERSGNAAAAEVLSFWQSLPLLRFEASDGHSGGWASFDPGERKIKISFRLLESVGIRPAEGKIDAAALRRLFDRSAPSLIHESVHAMTVRDLGFVARGVHEDELLAYIYQSWYVAGEPSWATKIGHEAGCAWLDEYNPLIYAYMKAEDAMLRAGRAAEVAEKNGKPTEAAVAAFNRAKVRMEELQRQSDAKIAALPDRNLLYELQVMAEWAAFTRGWSALEEILLKGRGRKHSVFMGKARLKERVAKLRADRRGEDAASDVWVARSLDEALALWADPRKLGQTLAYFKKRLADVKKRAEKARVVRFSTPSP